MSKLISLKDLVDSLRKNALTLVNAEFAAVYLLEGDSLQCDKRIATLGQGIVGEIFLTGNVVALAKPVANKMYDDSVDSIPPRKKTPNSLIGAPLIGFFDGIPVCLGVLQVFNKKNVNHEFTNDDVTAVCKLCSIAGNVQRNVKIMQSIAELYRKTIIAHDRSHAFLEVSRSLSQTQTVGSLASVVAQQVQRLLSVERCTLFFVDHTTNELMVSKKASHGVTSSFLSWIRGIGKAPSLPFMDGSSIIRFPINKGIAGYVATSGEALHIKDVYKDDRFNPEMDVKTGFRTRSMLCLPMKNSANEVIGVIQAINKDESLGELDAEDQDLLETFAAHAAIATQNSTLMQELRHSLAQSDALLEVTNALSQELKLTPLVKIIVSKVQVLLDVERCTLFIVDDKTLYTTSNMSVGAGAALPIPEDREDIIRFSIDKGIVGYVARSGESLLIPDAYKDSRFNRAMDNETGFRTRNILCTPVQNHLGECLGVCQVMNKRGGSSFNDGDRALLSAFSAQAAVAISNSRLFTETERALNHALREVRNLKFMLSVTKNLSSEMQMTTMMRQMKLQLHDLLKADHCYIYSVDKETNEIRRIDNGGESKAYSLSTGLTGVVARTGTSISIPCAAMKDSRFHKSADSSKNRCESFLCSPIKANDEKGKSIVIGLISVQDEENRGGFGSEEQNLLRVFAAQASVALLNAKKFNKVVEDATSKQKESSASEYLKNTRGMNLGTNDIEDFEYTVDEIQLGKSIGTGSYGEVWLAKARGNVVAIKKLFTRNLNGEQVDAFCSEASLMCQLRHRNVVSFKGAVTQPPDLCIITDFCSRGSLAHLLLNHSIDMNMEKKIDFILDAAEGMHYLHTSNPIILHRDLKSDNLLVDKYWNVKVADFGLTRFMDDKKAMTQVGTPIWMAPEVILGEKYTTKADVYAFGIIIWEILTRKEPYTDKEAMQIVVEVVNDELRPNIEPELKSNRLYPLMTDCWHQDPNSRPTFKAILERLHQFKNEITKENIDVRKK